MRTRLGEDRVSLFGFWAEDNPVSHISKLASGHDFAIVDGRYLVDGWVVHVEAIHDSGVIDLEDAANNEMISYLYGNPLSWESKRNELSDPNNDIPQRLYERLENIQLGSQNKLFVDLNIAKAYK